MHKTKMIVIGALMAAIAAIFQSLPVLLSEAVIVFTILSAVPIYIASRINLAAGVMSYLVAAILISFMSTHEAVFFLCTNGAVGVSLGSCRYFNLKLPFVLIISSCILTITLGIMNFGIGIPVFGTQIPGAFIVQLLILLSFSLVYNLIYLFFTDIVFNRLKKMGIIENDQ